MAIKWTIESVEAEHALVPEGSIRIRRGPRWSEVNYRLHGTVGNALLTYSVRFLTTPDPAEIRQAAERRYRELAAVL